ncbi:hypothetical protein [Akkermansia muciniphila]|uniref:hypothetical protein n=1 Tax=Akkermansia muciniphila TaxID=239935 RepID=UPI003CCFA95B
MKAPRSAGESSALVERFRGLGERQVLLDCPDLRLVHQSHLAKLALALAGLLLEDVALALFTAQYLARAGYLETLGDCLAVLLIPPLRVMVEGDYRLFPNTQVFFMQIFSSDDGKWALPDHTLPGAFDAAGCIKK